MPRKPDPVLLCLIAAALLLAARAAVMSATPLRDPTETRYGNLCWNMCLDGDYVQPRMIHRGKMTVFDGKPPLYFQLGGLFCALFGKSGFAVRLPALFCGILILLMLCFTVRRLCGKRPAAFSLLLCTATPFYLIFCGVCLTDMTLTLSVSGAVFSYMLFSAEEPGWRKKIFSTGFFFFLGLGMLAKGPVAIVLAGLPVFLYVLCARKWADLKHHAWFAGSLIFLITALPWYILMQQRNPEFLKYFFLNENFKRFLFKEYGDKFGTGHTYFRGVALAWSLVANAPGLLLCLAALFKKETRGNLFRKSDLTSGNPSFAIPFFTCVSITLFWCLTATVPIHYLLPAVPSGAIFAALFADRSGCFENPAFERFFRRACLVLGVLTLAGMLLASGITGGIGQKLPQKAYRLAEQAALDLAEKSPDRKLPEIYVARKVPYSAEFYLGRGRFVPHGPEDAWVSLFHSADSILMMTEEDICTFLEGYRPENPGGKFPPRRLIGVSGQWHVYAPWNKDFAALAREQFCFCPECRAARERAGKKAPATR